MVQSNIRNHLSFNQNKTLTLGSMPQIKEVARKLYSADEINEYDLQEAINYHPLANKPVGIRSKLAYKEIMKSLKPTTKYILPGQLSLFGYAQPKFAEDLEFYDMTPLVLSFGIFKTNDSTVREIGLNLHYYPPFARAKVLNRVYEVFKPYFDKQFNEEVHKPNQIISYNKLKSLIRRDAKIAFGVKEYIPVLRSNTIILPTRLFSTAFYTEGHFSKATMNEIFKFWRKFNRFS